MFFILILFLIGVSAPARSTSFVGISPAFSPPQIRTVAHATISNTPQSVLEWLESLGMPQYAEELHKLGYTVISTLAALNEEDLIEAKVTLDPTAQLC